MEPFHKDVDEYKKRLGQGAVQRAYKGLMEYVMALRTHFKAEYPDYFVSGTIYPGYLDMTYFSFTPRSLHDRKLKIAVVLIHEAVRFEVWLGGYNKSVQQKYWQVFKTNGWTKYHLVSTTQGVDSIVEHVLVEQPDFSDLEILTQHIEKATLKFIKDVETFLEKVTI